MKKLFFICLVSLSFQSHAYKYEIVEHFPANSSSYLENLYSLNNNTQIVGETRTSSPFKPDSHIFEIKNGTLFDISETDYGLTTELEFVKLMDINDAGYILGCKYQNSNSTSTAPYSCFSFHPSVGFSDFSGYNVSAINNHQHVIGSHVNSSGFTRAFLYNGSTFINLGTLAGRHSKANDINDQDQVVGESDFMAYVYSNGAISSLGTLPGDTHSYANAINNSGVIVGASYSPPGSNMRGFVYKAETGMLSIEEYGGEIDSTANDINNNNQIVGLAYRPYQSHSRWPHGVIYENGEMKILDSLITNPNEWLIQEAYKINDKGQILALAIHASAGRQRVLLDPLATDQNDFGNDYKADIVFRNTNSGLTWLYEMNGSAIQSSKRILATSDSNWQIKGIGDLNGDNYSDLLWRHQSTGVVWLYQMKNNTIVNSRRINIVSDLGWEIKGIADFNGDKNADIVWRHSVSGENKLYLMNGSSITAAERINFVLDMDWEIVAVDDFDNDKNADILWRNKQSGLNWIYLMDGNQIKSSNAVINVPVVQLDWKMVGVGDFNGDKKADVLWKHKNTNQVYLHIMDGHAVVSNTHVVTETPDWDIQQVSDFNGDGYSDILWRNTNSGQFWVYLMNGDYILNSHPVTGGATTDQSWVVQ